MLNNAISATGTFDLTVGSGGLNVHADAKLSIFGINFNLVADAIINTSGLVIRTQIGSSFRPFDGVEISGTLMFELNTTNSSALGIPARTVRVSVADATLNVIGFKATGSLTITISPSHFRIEVSQSHPLSLTVGPLSVGFYGYFDALNGHVTFSFTATGSFHATAGPAYLDAEASLTITDHSFSFHASGSAGLEIAGFRIGVTVSADITISNNHLDVAARGCVDLLVDEACLTVHFSLGDLDPPGASQVPPPPVLATKLSGGVLRLNIGSYASARNGFGDIVDETFFVTHAGGTSGNEDVTVSAFGLDQTYTGITRIVVYDAGSGVDYVQISAGVLSGADLNGGIGDDTLTYLGSGVATLNGGDGNDLLISGTTGATLNGGSGNDRLLGGSGNDTLDGGTGDDTVSGGGGADTLTGGQGVDNVLGGAGDDLIIWRLGDGLDTIDGNAGTNDLLRVTLSGLNDVAAYTLNPTGFLLTVGLTLGPANVEASELYALAGSDNVTVNAVGGSILSSIHIFFGDDAVADTFVFNGSAATDNLTVSVASNTVTVARSGGVSIAIDNAEAAKGGATLTLNLADGADSVSVAQTLGGTTTFVNGGPGNDTVRVGPGASVDGIAGRLVVNGDGESDTLQVDDLEPTVPETMYLTSSRIWGLGMPGSSETDNGITYGGIETLNIQLGARADTVNVRSTASGATTSIFTGTTAANVVNVGSLAGAGQGNVNGIAGRLVITGQSAADTLNVDETGETTGNTGFLTSTRIWGLGMPGSTLTDNGITYGSIESLNIVLGSGADEFTILSTHTAPTSLKTGTGDDRVAVRTISGQTSIDTQDGSDTVNVGSLSSPAGTSGNIGGNVDGIQAALVIEGSTPTSGSDVLNVDESGELDANDGTLTSTTLTGLQMAPAGITYSGFEHLNIWLGSASDTFTVVSTHVGTTDLKTGDGGDFVAVRSIAGVTTVDAGAGSDTVNVGSLSTPTATGNGGGNVDAIQSALVVIGSVQSGGGIDRLNVDDSGDTSSNDGVLTSTTITGLDMAPGGITYSGFEDLNIWLGTGGDRFFVDSTHAATTQLYAGNGTEAVNEVDDQIWVNTIAGVTSLYGQEGNDTLRVNVVPDAPGTWSFVRTNLNGISAVLNLFGGGGTDAYTVHLANAGNALINVVDQGAPDDGVDTLVIEGADLVAGLSNRPNDLFLVRHDFVALINDSDGVAGVSAGDAVERVNYSSAVNGRLTIRGLGGNDKFVVDDNGAITTLDGGAGNDSFQIGQVFNTPRADIAGLFSAPPRESRPVTSSPRRP